MKKGWLIYSKEESIRNRFYIESYKEEGELLDMEILLIIAEELEVGVKCNQWYVNYEGEEIEKPDFAICRIMFPLLTSQLEYMGIKTFNNSKVSEICNHKGRTYQYVANSGISIVDTEFVKKEFIEEKLYAMSYPSIVKTAEGHGGREVFLVNQEDIQKVIKKCEGKDIVIQPFIGSSHQDLRVYVMGRDIIGAVLRTAKEGFKSNFCLGGSASFYHLSQEESHIINKIIELFSFDFVGIDFIIGDKGELIFNEIEDVVGSRMLYLCSDLNVAALYLKYIYSLTV